jgi:hypothetical protein
MIFVETQGITPLLTEENYNFYCDSVQECTEISGEKTGFFFNFNKISSDTGLLLFNSMFSVNKTKPEVKLICLKDVILTARFGKRYEIKADLYPNLENISIEMKRIESIAEGSFPEDVKGISIWAPKLKSLPKDFSSKSNLENFYLETDSAFSPSIFESSWPVIRELCFNLEDSSRDQLFNLSNLEYLELFNTKLELEFVLKLGQIKSLKKLILFADFSEIEKKLIQEKLPFQVDFKTFKT